MTDGLLVQTATQQPAHTGVKLSVDGWVLACPRCGNALEYGAGDGGSAPATEAACAACGVAHRRRDGVWDLMTPDEAAAVDLFVQQYTQVRLSEGRAMTAAELRALPDTVGRHSRRWEWRVRRAGYETLLSEVLPRGAPGLAVADMGAGTGWLSHRLARLGHRPIAVDVSIDSVDGLGAAVVFDDAPDRPLFPRVRANYGRLPLMDASADAVVFNASLHYSPEPLQTIRETLRLLRPEGLLVILDSPFYTSEVYGEAMVSARRHDFDTKFGFQSDAHGGREYFTWDALADLGEAGGLTWTVLSPWRGARFALRAWRARLLRRRPTAVFPVVVGRRTTTTPGSGRQGANPR